MRLVVEGGHVVDPATRSDRALDLVIEDGVIRELVAPGSVVEADERVDASGLWVLPGLVDMHVHFREPGEEHKETIASGTRSAAAGGVTTVACMANTTPVNDNAAVTDFILRKARTEGIVKVRPIGAVTRGLEGKELADLGELAEAGCVAYSDDGNPVMSAGLLRHALEYGRAFDRPIISHCEDHTLTAGGAMHEGDLALRLGIGGMPSIAEDVMVGRDIALAAFTDAPIHIAHISTADAVDMVRQAKAKGIRVTAEATPHHFVLTDDRVEEYDTHAKMNPPLRSTRDRDAVLEGLADGTIDAIATDHAPHDSSCKLVEFSEAAFGIVGLETMLSLTLGLVRDGVIDRLRAVELMSSGPAGVLGIAAGSLEAGRDADLVLVDPDRKWKLDPSAMRTRSRNTPFEGWPLEGRAVMTYVRGERVHMI